MVFIDTIPNGAIRDVYTYWLRQRSGGRLPLKRDIDPLELSPNCLPDLFLYRLENDRFRCILVGTRVVHMTGRDETGSYLDEGLPPEHVASRQRLFERTVRDRLPVYYVGPARIANPRFARVSRLLLPVSSDGVVADHVFGIARFGPAGAPDAKGRARSDPFGPARIVVATRQELDEPDSR